jgi:glutamyl-tRNA synthetase
LPYVAEPGSKNKLSKRKLDKYLKNSDFRAAYEHGLEKAAFLEIIFGSAVRSTPDSAEDVSELQNIVASLADVALDVPILSDDVHEQEEVNKVWLEHFTSLFQNPNVLKAFRLGKRKVELLGASRAPELFNPIIVNFYEDVGYLPDAVLNYLLLLGWSLDDKTEEFSREEMLRYFSLDRVNKAPASFDPGKLMAIQARAMQRLSPNEKTRFILRFLSSHDVLPEELPHALFNYYEKIIVAAGDRIKVASDILEYLEFFWDDNEFPFDEEALENRLIKPTGAMALLRKFADELAEVQPYIPAALENMTNDFVAKQGIKLGDVVHAVRVAVTGKAVGFGLFDTLAILGRERCLARIDRALQLARRDKPAG